MEKTRKMMEKQYYQDENPKNEKNSKTLREKKPKNISEPKKKYWTFYPWICPWLVVFLLSVTPVSGRLARGCLGTAVGCARAGCFWFVSHHGKHALGPKFVSQFSLASPAHWASPQLKGPVQGVKLCFGPDRTH